MVSERKTRSGVVYSTDPDFVFHVEGGEEMETLPPARQNLRVSRDKKQRKGKVVTLITGFIGRETDLQELARLLKVFCGVGGTAKDGEILIQGDFCDKVLGFLQQKGYKARKTGG